MKFRYIILGLDGSAPEGTDNPQLAQHVADTNDEIWVIDAETGTILGLQGDEDNELQEANAEDHDFEGDDEEGDDTDDEEDDND